MPLGDAAVMPLQSLWTLSQLGQHCSFIQCLEPPNLNPDTPVCSQAGLLLFIPGLHGVHAGAA